MTTHWRISILADVVGVLGKLVFRIAAVVLGAMPESLREMAANTSGKVLYVFSAARRKNVRRNLSHIGIMANSGTIQRVFKNHTRNLIDIFASSRQKAAVIQDRIEFRDKKLLDEALAGGRGAILATVHVGNWELGALYLSSLGYILHAVAGVQMNRFLTEEVKEAKEKMGVRVINPRHSYRKLFKALESNQIVALLLDGDIYKGYAEVAFFGRKIMLPKGAVHLAKRTGAPILGGYCKYTGGKRYHLHIDQIVPGAEIHSLSETEILERLYGTMEHYIRLNSDQWCIFRDFWGGID